MFSIIDNICFAPRMCVIYVNVTSTSVNRGGAASSGQAVVVPIAKPQYRFCLCSPVLPAIHKDRKKTVPHTHRNTTTHPPYVFSWYYLYLAPLSLVLTSLPVPAPLSLPPNNNSFRRLSLSLTLAHLHQPPSEDQLDTQHLLLCDLKPFLEVQKGSFQDNTAEQELSSKCSCEGK